VKAAVALIPLMLLTAIATAPAQDTPAEPEEKPYDEIGFIRDNVRLSLSFTQGSTDTYNYEDLRIYMTGQAHYAFEGDDYLDVYVFVNRFDRAYDDPRYGDEPLSNILDTNLTYVFDGVDKYEYGFHSVAGATFFSDDMFSDVDFGVGYGGVYNYEGGDLRLMAGMGRNLGYKDSWTPLADLGWTHNQRLSPLWTLRTKADVMWNRGRNPMEEGEDIDPDAVYLLDGMLSYQLVKGWSVYLRYYNDNSADRSRSYVSAGLSHNFRRRKPKGR